MIVVCQIVEVHKGKGGKRLFLYESLFMVTSLLCTVACMLMAEI